MRVSTTSITNENCEMALSLISNENAILPIDKDYVQEVVNAQHVFMCRGEQEESECLDKFLKEFFFGFLNRCPQVKIASQLVVQIETPDGCDNLIKYLDLIHDFEQKLAPCAELQWGLRNATNTHLAIITVICNFITKSSYEYERQYTELC